MTVHFYVSPLETFFLVWQLKCGWSHAVLSCTLNVDWLFMGPKKEWGGPRFWSVTIVYWCYEITGTHYLRKKDHTEWDRSWGNWGRRGGGWLRVSSFLCEAILVCVNPVHCRRGWSYVELLLLVVDACQRDKN